MGIKIDKLDVIFALVAATKCSQALNMNYAMGRDILIFHGFKEGKENAKHFVENKQTFAIKLTKEWVKQVQIT